MALYYEREAAAQKLNITPGQAGRDCKYVSANRTQ